MAKNTAHYKAYLLRVSYDEAGKPRYIRLQDIQVSAPALYFHDAEQLAAFVWSDADTTTAKQFDHQGNETCDGE